MRVTAKATTGRELDLTHALVAAVAHELWKDGGGNEVVNWLEAERIVHGLTGAAESLPTKRAGKVERAIAPERVPQRRTWEDPPARRRREADVELVTGPIPYR
ncbi:MAG: hypothetical protein ACKVW3_10780 [Phycisphaerales bacterium]